MNHMGFTQEGINHLISNLYSATCKTAFDEDFEKDVVEFYDSTSSVVDATDFRDIVPLLNKRFNIQIEKYSVMELNELDVNFVFFFKLS